MSIRQILQVWEHEFSHPHQAVMLALADHAHEDGTAIKPSIIRIAWKTGYSERSVQNIMSQLRQLGILVVTVPATHNTPNEYKFDWSAATQKPCFDDFIAQKKGRKGRGAEFAPLSRETNRADKRGAVAMQQGCNSDELGAQLPCSRDAVAVIEGCSSDETGVQLPCNRGAVAVQEGCNGLHPIRKEPSREPSIETKEPETKANPEDENLRFGMVTYQRPPDEIDFAELWATNPGMAKMELRAIALGHKRLEMVAHGFGRWWVGPGLNDFDEFLIKACQKRKRKFQQPDSVGDAKTFINNMLKSGDWGNFSLRCDEAKDFQSRTFSLDQQVTRHLSAHPLTEHLQNSQTDRLNSFIGLAKFKVSQGDYARAKEIADLFGFPYETIGLRKDGKCPMISATA
ncbi:MAG: helix-turn-helix domain-containing protein [Cyanobacteria bacterium J06627_28]